jgi:ABC-2 type transport system permease protein
MNRMLLIFRRELKELRRNRTFFQTMAVFPVIMVLLPFTVVLFFGSSITQFSIENTSSITKECEFLGGFAACDSAGVIANLVSIAFCFFLPVPTVLPMTIAAYSVVGERERKSLEPLLATPVRTPELLLGKSLSAIVPTTLLVWASFLTLIFLLRFFLPDAVFGSIAVRTDRVDIGLWLAVIAVWTPLLAFVTTMTGVAISARARDARAAQQYGSLLALPVVGIVLGIALGFFNMTWLLMLGGAFALVVLAFGVYRIAAAMFRRETILTQWK